MSKRIAFIILALAFITGCSSANESVAPTSSPTLSDSPSSTPSPAEPAGPSAALVAQIAKAFFREYVDCVNNQFTSGTQTDCVGNNSNANSDLQSNLDKSGMTDADPILCAQNTANTFKVAKPQIIGKKAKVDVTQIWEGGPGTVSTLHLIAKSDGRVLVSNVTCN